MTIDARYLAIFEKPLAELDKSLNSLLEELGASYEPSRLNPATNQHEQVATVDQNIEYLLTIGWKAEAVPPIVVTFDIKLDTAVEPYRLDKILVPSVKVQFSSVTLVYNSLGRTRNIEIFPLLLDLENVVRELIVSVLMSRYGTDWWKNIIVANGLNSVGSNTSEGLQEQEAGSNLHDYFEMQGLYYLNFDYLRKIIDKVDSQEREKLETKYSSDVLQTRKVKHEIRSSLPFESVFANHDEVSLAAKISEIRELRNRVMHGRYLTEKNEAAIRLVCSQFHRFLVKKNQVGNFADRKLD